MTPENDTGSVRLNQFLAKAGVASRRGSEELIRDGRVSVNGETIKKLATTIDPGKDRVSVDGEKVTINERMEYWVLYKPREVVSTLKDPEGRACLALYIPKGGRGLFPVGRLDYHSEGLILLTNNGELSNRLLHPRYKVEKTYTVKVKGNPDKDSLDRLRGGIRLESRKTLPVKIRRMPSKETKHTWLEVKMTEGRKNQLREMFYRIQHPVIKLKRIQLGPIKIGNMRPGELRALNPSEANELLEHAGLKEKKGRKKNSRKRSVEVTK